MRGFHIPTLQRAEAQAKGATDKDIITSLRNLRDSGAWGRTVSKQTLKTTVGAKKIVAKKPIADAKPTLKVGNKVYNLLSTAKTKKEATDMKNSCVNACFLMRVVAPSSRGDVYKIYARKK